MLTCMSFLQKTPTSFPLGIFWKKFQRKILCRLATTQLPKVNWIQSVLMLSEVWHVVYFPTSLQVQNTEQTEGTKLCAYLSIIRPCHNHMFCARAARDAKVWFTTTWKLKGKKLHLQEYIMEQRWKGENIGYSMKKTRTCYNRVRATTWNILSMRLRSR